ncbi:hypothetical protein CEXT_413841 [Caerostris extrusa]|uniref:Uncharacterized protein n=1 Tax=Caerostris extrusa TaxID=172846 RepID=A0AAV4TNN2_CAEEX|nr:hypothetical protein CEXT_413841 [Caerostris extrusa]
MKQSIHSRTLLIEFGSQMLASHSFGETKELQPHPPSSTLAPPTAEENGPDITLGTVTHMLRLDIVRGPNKEVASSTGHLQSAVGALPKCMLPTGTTLRPTSLPGMGFVPWVGRG